MKRLAVLLLVWMAFFGFGVHAQGVLRMAGFGPPPTAQIERFAEQTGIAVEYEWVSGSYNFMEKVVVWTIAGTLPDVLAIPYWGLPQMATQGSLRPLDDLMEQDVEFRDGFLPQGMESFRWEGQLYGVPWVLAQQTILFDRSLFLEAGIPTPYDLIAQDQWSMENLILAARKLTDPVPDGSGFNTIGLFTRTDQMSYYAPLIWALGGDILANDGRTLLLRQQSSQDAVVRLAELFTERIFLSNSVRGEYGLDYMEVLTQRDVGMRAFGVYLLQDIKNANPMLSESIDIAPYPAYDGVGTNGIDPGAIGISSTTEQPEVAWQFLKCALADPVLEPGLPAVRQHFDVWVAYMEDHFGVSAARYLQVAGDSLRLSPRAVNPDVEQAICLPLQEALLGRRTISQVLDRIELELGFLLEVQ